MQEKSAKETRPSMPIPNEAQNGEQSADDPQNWDLKDLASQASQAMEDEIYRQGLRGDETQGDADERDIAGRSQTSETWQGREEAKNDVKGKSNANG